MIVADTGAIVALVDADDRNHRAVLALFRQNPDDWILPWAVLPEIDYLLQGKVGEKAAHAFMTDLASGAYRVEWGKDEDLDRARELNQRYRDLNLGLVDAVVIAIAERRSADAIVTFDLRHFSAVKIRGEPLLLPRDS